MINAFVQDIENIHKSSLPDAQTAYEVRKVLANNLASVNFKVSCIEHVLDEMKKRNIAYVPAIYSDTEFDLRLIYWPQNFANDIHAHDSLTVTGVFFNELIFKGYKATQANEEVAHRLIHGKMNEVGYMLAGELHNVSNETPSPSISLHFFKKSRVIEIDNADSESKAKKVSYRNFDVIECQNIANLSFLASLKSTQADLLIEKLFEVASLRYKLVILKQAISLNLDDSKRFCNILLQSIQDDELKKLLLSIGQKL
jgi:predicted metal-dependent enzyme (double-stranded beta helix superfamily)